MGGKGLRHTHWESNQTVPTTLYLRDKSAYTTAWPPSLLSNFYNEREQQLFSVLLPLQTVVPQSLSDFWLIWLLIQLISKIKATKQLKLSLTF